MTAFTYDFFISAVEADQAWVEQHLLPMLTAANKHYLTEAEFQPGQPRLLELERAITHSEKTLLILSAAYLQADSNLIIDLFAMHYGLETRTWPVIPLLLAKLELPPRLRFVIPLDFSQATAYPDSYRRLLNSTQLPSLPKPLPVQGLTPVQKLQLERQQRLTHKLARLQNQYDLETREEEKIRLEYLIKDTQASLDALSHS